MKLEKKHLVIIAVAVVIFLIWWWMIKSKQKESGYYFWNRPLDIKRAGAGCTKCWVTSVEDGMEYCRWYDDYGRNTQTYAGRGCTGGQANMGLAKRKPWWAKWFN